MQPVTTPKS